MSDVCGDNRFEVIAEAKKDLLESTNIEMRADEMAVIDNILFRCWQMGWLKQYETYDFCSGDDNPCKEYDREKHCCHRWPKVIRQAVEEMKAEHERKKGKWSNYKDEHCCSVCKCVVISECWDDDIRYDYCPYCGADMRGE